MSSINFNILITRDEQEYTLSFSHFSGYSSLLPYIVAIRKCLFGASTEIPPFLQWCPKENAILHPKSDHVKYDW